MIGRKCHAAIGLVLAIALSPFHPVYGQGPASISSVPTRERLLFDDNWRFALGHATDPSRDFNPANSFPFNYLAKTGFAVGAAAADFDDRGWRELDLPHEWAVELPFDERGSLSHGSKAIGLHFPENSVGWYRKKFFISAEDLGKRITLEFDGVFRDSVVWINGHFLGREESGYSDFAYNVSEFLNYGGENVIAVRVDATLEEGWFYEGAGIYRHVWLTKTEPLHVARHGTFVTSEVQGDVAKVAVQTSVINEGEAEVEFLIENSIVDDTGSIVANSRETPVKLRVSATGDYNSTLTVSFPRLWDLANPHMYDLVTTLIINGTVVDRYQTPFGIRSIRFDPDKGFFLNGKHVRLYGTNNHQDHAGVGSAIPDALYEYRITKLKEFGCNAYRCSHNPPAPQLLDICDRLGMLVIDENRLMGTSSYHLDHLRRLVVRDRNHPSIILWSIGNEEWGIEGNKKGELITSTMQAFVRNLDRTRRTTVASSGNWGRGDSVTIDTMGFNYYTHGSTDDFHESFPDKPSVGTEEGSTFSTRGVYVEDRDQQHLTAYDENKPDWGALAHEGWQHYADRPYVAGLFIWTGFDYRGEPTPFKWPAINSQFGILDTCGFRKDNSWYYQAQWIDEPVLHLLPHWNWEGKEGREVRVWVHSNCDTVELWLNSQSLGRMPVERFSHAAWSVEYAPGTLVARGFRGGQEVAHCEVATTSEPVAVQLIPHRSTLVADGQDVSVVTIQAIDAEGRAVPTADHEISLEINGPGRIIGVGNGDPSSHEADKFVPTVEIVELDWRTQTVDGIENRPEVAVDFQDTVWNRAFVRRNPGGGRRGRVQEPTDQPAVFRAAFESPELTDSATVTLFLPGRGKLHSVHLNGDALGHQVPSDSHDYQIEIERERFRSGKNVIAFIATGWTAGRTGRSQNRPNFSAPALRIVDSPRVWKRRLFNGLAQVIVQSTPDPGLIYLRGSSPDLEPATIELEAKLTLQKGS